MTRRDAIRAGRARAALEMCIAGVLAVAACDDTNGRGHSGTDTRMADAARADATPDRDAMPDPDAIAPTHDAATALMPTCSRKIAFEADAWEPEQSTLFTVRTDGSELVKIASSGRDDDSVSWSRDGTKLAFRSNRTGSYDVYVATPDGAEITNLTESEADDAVSASRLAWSPAGEEVVVRLGAGESGPGLYVVGVDGSQPRRVTGSGTSATFSPGGDEIVFADGGDIHVVNRDGSNRTRLTEDGSARRPAWSPGGDRILFESERDGNVEIYVMAADGTGETNVTRDSGEDFRASWHPDGSKILFARRKAQEIDRLYVVGADGRAPAPVVDFAIVGRFSPDGTNIAARASEFGRSPVLTNPDGSGYVFLGVPDEAEAVRAIRWQPCDARPRVTRRGAGRGRSSPR